MYKTIVILLLILWGTRLASLEALPLHNDEGLHLTRAVEVWNLHPFWEIRDGKIVNHWLIAAFYPQNAPVFAGRVATVFTALIGLAAGMSIARRAGGAGVIGMITVGLLWIPSGYLYFYERLAFSDAQAGALVVLALWAAFHLCERGTIRNAILTGACFGLALLFKFTAAPFALSIAIVVLAFARYPVAQRLRLLLIAAITVGMMFIVPVGYLLLRGEDLFSIALGWIGGGSGSAREGVLANLSRFWATWTGFDNVLPYGIAAAAVLFMRANRKRVWFACTALLPLAAIIVLGREALPRHFVVALPALLVYVGTLAGATLNILWHRTPTPAARWGIRAAMSLVALLLLGYTGLRAITASDPLRVPIPDAVIGEHVIDHSAGYGLREAVQDFPNTITPPDAPILASMFPDSCRRANFYVRGDLSMICTDAPGIDRMTALLAEHAVIYVLTDTPPIIGADMAATAEQLRARLRPVAAYPRPGETVANASVVLWRLES